MVLALQVLTVMLVALAMALAMAHALELPGKRRLSREQYLATQPIYYPGFTIGGLAEPAAILLMLLLLLLTPAGGAAFWLVVAAFVMLLAMHGAYWLLTHPVNRFWVEDVEMKPLGQRFFGSGLLGRLTQPRASDWTSLRDRWELSHVVRAGFGLASLVLLVTAVTL